MRDLCLILLWSVTCSAFGAAVNITPNPASPGNLGALSNPFTNVYGVHFWSGAVELTNSSGFISSSGGTVSGAILSTSSTTNAPSSTELATAGWIRGLFNAGVFDYATTNIDTQATNTDSATPVYKFESTIPPSSSRAYINPTNNQYIGSIITTNTFTFLQGPVSVNAYMALSTGGSDAITVHPEIYYSYDKTNWYGDWDCQGQAIAKGTTNLYQFVVSFPAVTATNPAGFYLERRFRVNTAAGTPTLTFLIGTNVASGTANASHISFAGPNSGYGNAYLANNQTWTGSNAFLGPTYLASGVMAYGTNADNGVVVDATRQYQLFVTNATMTVSGFSGLLSGSQHILSITVSNSAATAIVWNAPPYCHFPTNGVSTNAMTIPASQEMIASFWIRSNIRTNLMNVLLP